MRDKIDYILIIYGDVPKITPDDTFSDLGFDSLDFLEVIIEIEKEFGIHIKPNEINKSNRIQDLYDVVSSKIT